MTTTCLKCGGQMEEGFAMCAALGEKRVFFVVSTTSPNPIEAFKQGLAGEAADRAYRIDGVRCSRCGFLELYAGDPASWLP